MAKPYRTEWDLTPLASGDDDPAFEEKRRVITEKNRAFAETWKHRTDYLTDPMILKDALGHYEAIQRSVGVMGDEGYYFSLRSAQNASDPAIKARFQKIVDFANTVINATQFFKLNVGNIPKQMQRAFLEHAALAPYRHFLEMLFARAAHTLSDAEERIMNMKDEPAHSQWVRMLEGFLAGSERTVLVDGGAKKSKSFSEITALLDHPTKEIRDSAAGAFNDILAQYAGIAEAEMNAIMANKKADDEMRGFSRPDASRHLADDIESDVVDAVVDAVSRQFSVARRYYALKAKLLGVPHLAYHERNVPYGTIEKTYSYDEGFELVRRVFRSLDPEFADSVARFAEDGRIDAFPKKGKHGGAFCAHDLLSQPVYILLNFSGKLRDVTTMAHEFGHGINDIFMQKTCNGLTFGTSLATAEVASTFMEDFIVKELLADADDELKLVLLMARLNDDVSTIFRQIACYRFEQELHALFRKKGYLSKDEIGKVFQKHMASYMGDAVEQSPGSENWWVYWGHIRTFFYVYSYASGLLISKAMQKRVRENHSFITHVKEFLSAGFSDSPRRIFERMGIGIADPAFWKDGIDEVERNLEYVETLARSLGKISS